MSGRPADGPEEDRDLRRVARVLVNIALRLTQAKDDRKEDK
jgi:hypothetical protein